MDFVCFFCVCLFVCLEVKYSLYKKKQVEAKRINTVFELRFTQMYPVVDKIPLSNQVSLASIDALRASCPLKTFSV